MKVLFLSFIMVMILTSCSKPVPLVKKVEAPVVLASTPAPAAQPTAKPVVKKSIEPKKK